MADSITGLGNVTDILWLKPSSTRNLTSSYLSNAKFLGFTGTTVESKRIIESIGQVLECTYQFYNQSEMLDFLTFFEDKKGGIKPFWVPVWENVFTLYSPILAGDNKIKIKPCYFTQTYQGYERIFLLLKDGTKIVRKVIDCREYDSYEELSLDTAIDIEIPQENISVFGRFILCRFAGDEITLDYETPYFAETKVKFIELPHEYDLDTDSAITSQFTELYEFSLPKESYYYTCYFEPIEYNHHTYVPAPIKRSRIEQTLNIFSDNRLEITARPTQAFREYLASTSLTQIKVKIIKYDIENAQGKVIYVGYGRGISMQGDYLTLSVSSVSSVFDHNIPKLIYQPICNNILFDNRCGLAKASWALATTCADYRDGRLVSDDFASKPNGWFTGGFVELMLGYGFEYRLITNHVGNTIYLQGPFAEDISGKLVNVYPGCDGSPATCKNKFNNLRNYVGFPYIKSRNPTIWGVR